jgi:hypothetical protein
MREIRLSRRSRADRIDDGLAAEIKDAVSSLEHIKVSDLMTLLHRIDLD